MSIKGAMIAASVAGLFTMGLAGVASAKKSDVMCSGVNACKGQSSCKGGDESCKGKNGCKGQGNMKSEQGRLRDQGRKGRQVARARPAAPGAPPVARSRPRGVARRPHEANSDTESVPELGTRGWGSAASTMRTSWRTSRRSTGSRRSVRTSWSPEVTRGGCWKRFGVTTRSSCTACRCRSDRPIHSTRAISTRSIC